MSAANIPGSVLGMPQAEWVEALGASNMPRQGDHTPEQIASWIVQGTGRLGGDLAVWERARQTDRLLFRPWGQVKAEWKALWPSLRRFERAHDLSRALRVALMREGALPEFPTVTVDLDPDELGDFYSVEVPVRDLEMARRRTAALAGAA